jgi:hypothetical protein
MAVFFLSYASDPDADLAKTIAVKLRARGHDVFFDKDSLSPSSDFDKRIRHEIGQCDIFVFLAREASIAVGHYTRTELRIAEERWPSPVGRICVAELEPIDSRRLPYPMAAATKVTPIGNLATDIADAAEFMARSLGPHATARAPWNGHRDDGTPTVPPGDLRTTRPSSAPPERTPGLPAYVLQREAQYEFTTERTRAHELLERSEASERRIVVAPYGDLRLSLAVAGRFVDTARTRAHGGLATLPPGGLMSTARRRRGGVVWDDGDPMQTVRLAVGCDGSVGLRVRVHRDRPGRGGLRARGEIGIFTTVELLGAAIVYAGLLLQSPERGATPGRYAFRIEHHGVAGARMMCDVPTGVAGAPLVPTDWPVPTQACAESTIRIAGNYAPDLMTSELGALLDEVAVELAAYFATEHSVRALRPGTFVARAHSTSTDTTPDPDADDWRRLTAASDGWQQDLDAQAQLRWGRYRLPPVERDLLDTVEAELERESLIVTGDAGDGKSNVLAALYGRLRTRGSRVALLRLDEIPSPSLDGIQSDLGLARRLEVIIAGTVGTPPSYLLVDAVDTFEVAREQAWHQILRVALKDPGRWRVAMAIRRSTLEPAAAWKALFAGNPIASLQSDSSAITAVRHIVVPPLSAIELERLLAPVAGAWDVLSALTPRVRAVLATPFNLRIMMDTISPDAFSISSVRSRRLLLDGYWQQRVRDKPDGNDREKLLKDLAAGRVERTDEAVVGTSPLRRAALDGLVRDGVLRRAYRGGRLAFAHELLEDYVLSLMHDETRDVVDAFAARPAIGELTS